MVAYVHKLPGSKSLLEEGFKLNEEIKVGAIDFASRYLTSTTKSTADKSRKIYLRFLNDESDNVRDKYARCFKYFKIEEFVEIYDLLCRYSKSRAIEKHSRFFFKFLEKCVRNEPEKCIDLVENHSKFEKPDMRYNTLQGELIQIIIEAYNRTTADVYKEKALNLFDLLLQDSTYKSYGLEVLKEYDRE